jgi:hypothetical protein
MEIKRYCAYDKLLGLALQIIEIHRDITTFNAHKSDYALPRELANQRAQELYRLLVHSITCLHHRQRDKSAEGSYLSEEEDNTTALNLIQQILPLPEYSLCESELVIYKNLYEEYGTKQPFTIREITNRKYFKHENTRRIIAKLRKMGILKVTSGNRYKGGYWYQLVD